MRATYKRAHEIEHFLAFYDVHGDYLNGIFSSRRGVAEVTSDIDTAALEIPITRSSGYHSGEFKLERHQSRSSRNNPTVRSCRPHES